MPYKRRSHISGTYGSYGTYPTKVTIHWSMSYSAYAIKFQDTQHWNEMQALVQYLKFIPYGERMYDPDNKIWYLMDKHLPAFRSMIDLLPQYFEVDFQEKAANETFQGKFIPVDVYLDKFKSLTNTDIRNLEYTEAKKIYRRFAMSNHPDRGGDAKIMSEINECWSSIEREFYKQKKEPEYAI